ncbi:MAG TPA: acyl-CoA dehydrogenase family protein, partial [Jiangellaceae bacterium]|nr:acyl-CoA dehydrogenase family protein [Jiangellaceae bacterium]
RGLDGESSGVVIDEFRRVGAPGTAQDKHNLWANTVLAFGTDSLKQRFVRRLLIDDVRMCLLYSEPGAGSDLAGLQTRADRDGDEWVVNGQKVWTSSGKEAEYGMLVARTNWDVPKHRGISFFWCPMEQPGVEVRPIRQITGESHFNEVFLDDVRVPADHLVGPLDGGWRVLQTALAYERSVMGDVARGPRSTSPPLGASRDDEGEPQDDGTPAPVRQGAEVDLWVLAREMGRDQEPTIRQAIARVHILRTVNRWNGLRAKSQLEQGSSSPILSLGKLAMSRILHEGAHVQRLIVGQEAQLYGKDHPLGDDANFLSLNAFFTSIGGGTDQIQRNIIGERVLGLPREPEIDRDVPFKDVAKATVHRTT